MCVCVCVCACVRACVCCDVCIPYIVFIYVQMCVFVYVSVCVFLYMHGMRVLDLYMHTYVCACICKSQTYFRDKVGFGRAKLHFQ